MNALANRVRASFAKHGEPDLCCSLIMAFPSVMPMKAMITPTLSHNDSRTGFRTGDGTGKVMMTFQSRFGREPWLMPYTEKR